MHWIQIGNNRERFIVGRQLLLMFLVFFLTQACGGTARVTAYNDTATTLLLAGGGGGGVLPNAEDSAAQAGLVGANRVESFSLWGWQWSESMDVLWLQNHLLYIFMLTVVGNLVTQSVASEKMLGFLNLPVGLYHLCVVPSLVIEWIGVTHVTYLLRDLVVHVADLKGGDESLPAQQKNAFFWLRAVLSLTLFLFGGSVVFIGLLTDHSNDWSSLPVAAALALLILFLIITAGFAGMQVSTVELYRMPLGNLRTTHPWAYECFVVLRKGKNLQNFLIGRQVFISIMMVSALCPGLGSTALAASAWRPRAVSGAAVARVW